MLEYPLIVDKNDCSSGVSQCPPIKYAIHSFKVSLVSFYLAMNVFMEPF